MIWAGLVTFLAGAVVAALSIAAPEGAGSPAGLTGLVVMALGALLGGVGLSLRRRRAGGHVTGGVRAPHVQDVVYRTGRGKIAAMIIAAIYIISPIDVIPDLLLPVGIVDDATALSWLIFALSQEYGRRRQAARAPIGPATAAGEAGPGGVTPRPRVAPGQAPPPRPGPDVTPPRRRSPR